MLSKEEQSNLRGTLFRHLDGIVTAPAAFALKENGVCDYLLAEKSVSLTDILANFKANDGYLNVALRTLCSQGWLVQHIDNKNDLVRYEINDLSEIAFKHFDMYQDAVSLLRISEKYHPRKFEMEPFLMLESIFKQYKNNFGIELSSEKKTRSIQEQILAHIEGIIVGPTVVHLGMSGMFHKYFMETKFKAEEFHKNPLGFERLLDILTDLKWFNKLNGSYAFTEKGLFFAKKASAYGVTVSYIPTLRKLNDLIFGNPLILKNVNKGAKEKHVDREMNVWGSGGAHTSYFKVIDEIIIDLFNKPINEQPKGILDMGCGNGAFIQHLFSVIESQTYRGTVLDEYPLTLIGVDYNEAALKVSKANLIQADIWAKIIWGDIGDPKGLANDLEEKYGIDLKDLLNVRTFLDHNRIWKHPGSISSTTVTSSTGAYAFEGKRINNNLVLESLKQHFTEWLPYVKKFGLLLIELHTVNPSLVAQNLGRTAATAYDATHGYSDQYIIEIEESVVALREVGLIPNQKMFRKFPNSDLATVSVNLFQKM
ncbi:class I SAM-dependent methyltransferase [bacterium]|nr:class I SAM-dependent methyltransferase [bacterium]